jgi:hypothetical protein
MSEKKRHFLLSLFLLVFIWQVGFLCAGFLFQNNNVNVLTSSFIEEIEEEGDVQPLFFTDGFSDSDSEELLEEELEFNHIKNPIFLLKNLRPKKCTVALTPKPHFQNPFSPPEGVTFILN